MLNHTAFYQSLKKTHWFSPNLKLLVACSGGVDSTVLLHLLNNIPELHLEIVHFDHQLRGSESDRDRRFVEALGDKLNLIVHIVRQNVQAFAQQHRLSIEEAGSRLRKEKFLELKIRHNCDLVATGQHNDDQVETILINLYVGSGIRGLMGISSEVDGIIRPLLNVSRQEIVTFAKKEGLEYREDQSNTDTAYLRNNIRRNIIPKLMKPSDESIELLFESIISQGHSLNAMIERCSETTVIKEFNAYSAPKIALGMRRLADYFSPIQKAIFDRAFQLISNKPQGLSSSHFQSLQLLLQEDAIGKETQLPGSIVAVRDRDHISFFTDSDFQWEEQLLNSGQTEVFPFFKIGYESATLRNHIEDGHYFWYVAPTSEYTLRMNRPGDKITVDDSQRSVSVRHVLQSARLSPHLKPFFPVLEYKGKIVWIPGLRTASSAMVNQPIVLEEVKHCIKVQFQKGTFE